AGEIGITHKAIHVNEAELKSSLTATGGVGKALRLRQDQLNRATLMISRIIVEKRELFANGHEFAVTGAYEKIVGQFHGEVDPNNRLNKVIVNLDKAPRNKKGAVEYQSDFCIIKPLDMARGNGKILFDVPNRGSKRIIAFLNDAPATSNPTTLEDAGNGF